MKNRNEREIGNWKCKIQKRMRNWKLEMQNSETNVIMIENPNSKVQKFRK